MCSTVIFGKNARNYLAANYDFAQDHGVIATNLRGTRKSNGAKTSDRVVDWTVKFGSVTFNQFSLEFPVSGMNEAGLAIALMWHDEGDFGNDAHVLRLNELQWIQYQLDNYCEVAELIRGLEHIRPEKGPVPLHFSVLDATGAHVLIEFINGELSLQHNVQFPVLTNSSYARCLSAARDTTYRHLADESAHSVSRFVRLYRHLQSHSGTFDAASGFVFLDAVNASSLDDQGFPWNQGNKDTVTAWSTVFNPIKKTIQFKSNQNSACRVLCLDDVSFAANGQYQLMDVHHGQAGDASALLEPYSKEKNRELLRATVPMIGLPEILVDKLAHAVDELYQHRRMS